MAFRHTVDLSYQALRQLAATDWPNDYMKATNSHFSTLDQLSITARTNNECAVSSTGIYQQIFAHERLITRGETLLRSTPNLLVRATIRLLKETEWLVRAGKTLNYRTWGWSERIVRNQEYEDRMIYCKETAHYYKLLLGRAIFEKLAAEQRKRVDFRTKTVNESSAKGPRKGQTDSVTVMAQAIFAGYELHNAWGDRHVVDLTQQQYLPQFISAET